MELNDNTLAVLKNFASINPSIFINAGSSLRTVALAKNIVAQAELDQEFPQAFGIYDLNEFLSVLSLVDGPRLRFADTHVVIGDSTGRARVKYFFCDPDMLNRGSDKEIAMPECELSFNLDNDTLNKIKKASSVLGHGDLKASISDSTACLSLLDEEDKTSNSFTIDVDGDYTSEDLSFVWSIENFKVVPGDYTVQVSSKLISHFVNKDKNIQYWIALKK
jgi:hypothetical protein